MPISSARALNSSPLCRLVPSCRLPSSIMTQRPGSFNVPLLARYASDSCSSCAAPPSRLDTYTARACSNKKERAARQTEAGGGSCCAMPWVFQGAAAHPVRNVNSPQHDTTHGKDIKRGKGGQSMQSSFCCKCHCWPSSLLSVRSALQVGWQYYWHTSPAHGTSVCLHPLAQYICCSEQSLLRQPHSRSCLPPPPPPWV